MKHAMLIALLILGGCDNGTNEGPLAKRTRGNAERHVVDRERLERTYTRRDLIELTDREADIAGLPRNIFRGLVFVESGFNPVLERDEFHLCKKHKWDFSECRSIGLTQVIYGYHKGTCRLTDPEQLRDPETNLMCGARILKGLISRFGLKRGVERYNGGNVPGRYYEKVENAAKETTNL